MEQGDEMREIGKVLAEIRKKKGVNRQELADKVGCKYDDIRVYERGERIMRVDRLLRILNVLGIPVSENLAKPEVRKAAVSLSTLDPDSRRKLLNIILSSIKDVGEKE